MLFIQVNAQQVEMDTKFGAVHRAVLMLDKFECPLSPAVRKQFNFAPQRYTIHCLERERERVFDPNKHASVYTCMEGSSHEVNSHTEWNSTIQQLNVLFNHQAC